MSCFKGRAVAKRLGQMAEFYELRDRYPINLQSTVMPLDLIGAAHFAISLVTNLPR